MQIMQIMRNTFFVKGDKDASKKVMEAKEKRKAELTASKTESKTENPTE